MVIQIDLCSIPIKFVEYSIVAHAHAFDEPFCLSNEKTISPSFIV